jgi:hypothetical protein
MAGRAVSLCWTDKQLGIVADKNEQDLEFSVHFCDTGRFFCHIHVL